MAETLTGWVRGKTLELDSEAPNLDGKHVRVVIEPIDTPVALEIGGGMENTTHSSSVALEWIREHRREYAGRWVALDGDRLIAVASSARDAYSAARENGVEMPLVDFVEPEDEGVVWGGWL